MAMRAYDAQFAGVPLGDAAGGIEAVLAPWVALKFQCCATARLVLELVVVDIAGLEIQSRIARTTANVLVQQTPDFIEPQRRNSLSSCSV